MRKLRSGRPLTQRRGSLITFAASLSLAGPARATTEYGISALGSATYTNNLNNAATDTAVTDEGAADPTSGLLLQATPSVSLIIQQARGQLSLRYDHSFAYATLGAVSPGDTDALTASSSYELTGVDTLSFSANGTNSSLTNLLFSTGPSSVNGVQTAGTQRLLRLLLSEGWRHAWGPNWTTTQTTVWSAQYNLSDESESTSTTAPTNSIFTNSLDLSSTQGLDTFSLLGLLQSQRVTLDSNAAWTNVVSLSLGWLRPLTPNTSVNATVGAAQVLEPDSNPQAIGGAGITHELTIGQIGLAASRTQGPDQQTGRIFIIDSAIASYNSSLLRRLDLNSSLTASVSRRHGLGGQAPIDTISGSAAVGWTDGTYSAGLTYSILRQVTEQTTDLTPNLTRASLTLIVGATYP